MEEIEKFCFVIIAMLIALVMHGYVVMKLWAWFIVGIFNVPSIGFAQSIGLALIINFFSEKRISKDTASTSEATKALVAKGFSSLIFLGVAYIVAYLVNA